MNIHILDKWTPDDALERIDNDAILSPLARYILIDLIKFKLSNKGFYHEEMIEKEFDQLTRKQIGDAYKLLVLAGYLIRIIDLYETQFYIRTDAKIDEDLITMN